VHKVHEDHGPSASNVPDGVNIQVRGATLPKGRCHFGMCGCTILYRVKPGDVVRPSGRCEVELRAIIQSKKNPSSGPSSGISPVYLYQAGYR
jgi:hypothetical protein